MLFEPFIHLFQELFTSLHFTEQQALVLAESSTFIGLLLLSVIIYYITWYIIKRTVIRMIDRSTTKFDDILLHNKVLSRFSYYVPSFIVSKFVPYSLPSYPKAILSVQKMVDVYVIFVTMLVVSSLIGSFYDYYLSKDSSRNKPIKGLAQVLKLVAYIIGSLMILATLLDKNLGNIVIGLGTLSAVLMLVFKDPILGFVGGLQLSVNDMVRIGDWISMPKYNADGDVLEITLTTVKVQNFDKSITTIPTYALVSDSFINWRGMTEAGGRRVKRSLNLDMESVRFCDEQMLNKYGRFHLISQYVHEKETEIQQFNEENKLDTSTLVNGRRQTNLGVFRMYLTAYLKSFPGVHQELPVQVRQLQPSENGIPIEVYFFSQKLSWPDFENIQSDVFDHILAVLPEFGLRVFQHPSGANIEKGISMLNLDGNYPEQKE
ncbi:mechanosensitive ion channel [Bacteroidales bacterium]